MFTIRASHSTSCFFQGSTLFDKDLVVSAKKCCPLSITQSNTEPLSISYQPCKPSTRCNASSQWLASGSDIFGKRRFFFFFLWNCWKRLPPYSWGHFCETFSKSFWLKTNIFNLNSLCSCFFCRSVCRHLYHSLRWFPHQKNLKISSRRFLIGLPAGTDASIVCNDVLGHLGQVTQLQHGGFLQFSVAGWWQGKIINCRCSWKDHAIYCLYMHTYMYIHIYICSSL